MTVEFDTARDTKEVMSCSCPAYNFDYKACKHMFLLARWDPTYSVNGDHRPHRVTINLNPSSPSASTSQEPVSNNTTPSSTYQDPTSSSSTDAANTNDNASMPNPRDAFKSLINKVKRTFDQGSFDDEKLLDIIRKLDNVHSDLQQACIIRPNARLPTQSPNKRRRTRQ